MKNLTRPFTRRAWLAAVAVTAAGAVGVVAGPGSATPPAHADYKPVSAQGGQVQGAEAQAGPPDRQGDEGERQDRASPAGRRSRHPPGRRRRRRLGRLLLRAQQDREDRRQSRRRRRPRAYRREQRRLHRHHPDDDRRRRRKRHDRRRQRHRDAARRRGNDSIDGNGGNDLALLGAGNDTFVWDPGDGSDTVEGQDGADTMLFNGAGVAEQVDLSANGNRLRFFRVQANITMDTAGVERVDFNALGGADLVTVNDLTGTDVNESRTSTWPAPSAASPATARPTGSSSTPPTATTRSTSAETRRL